MSAKSATILLSTILACMYAGSSLAATLRVALASNFVPVMESISSAFEASSGHELLLSPGSTGRHYTQIVNGAPFDLFLAADTQRPALLESEGNMVNGTRITYALGRLILWSPDPDLIDTNASVLATSRFRHLAIANPTLAPYGQAARQVMEKLGLWTLLQGLLVQGENIAQTLQFVESGNAELGFIAYSQWQEIDGPTRGSSWEPPPALYKPIEQQAVILRDSAAAREFMQFLQDSKAREIIADAGYGLP